MTLHLDYIPLQTLRKHPRNPKDHDLSSIAASIQQFGYVNPVLIDETTQTLVAGHGRITALYQRKAAGKPPPDNIQVADNGDWLIPVIRGVAFPDETTRDAYLVADNRLVELGGWNDDQLADLLATIASADVDLLSATGYSGDDLDALLAPPDVSLFAEDNDPAPYVPDAIYPTNNEWGIPTLDLAMQATCIENPLGLWGSEKRTSKGVGTYFFYVDDYRFNALWKDPAKLVASECRVVLEPNYSVYSNTPAPLALWHTYQKRWLAKYWQTQGVRIVVDLNVSTQFETLNLLGVPPLWGAYACNGGDNDLTSHRYQLAEAHSTHPPALFVVYGGGKHAKAQCLERGWVYVPEFTERKFDN